MSKAEKYSIKTMSRKDITEAPYNPRKITDAARKKLKKGIKQFGLVQPIVYNKRTGLIVSGHQRLSILDEIEGTNEYTLNVCEIDVDETEEKKLNILLNNQSAMGAFDELALQEISLDIGFEGLKEAGFDDGDLFVFGIEKEKEEQEENIYHDIEEAEREYQERKERKKDVLKSKQSQDDEGIDNCNTGKDDYLLTFIFNTNQDKARFMETLTLDKKERFLKSGILYDLLDGKYERKYDR